MSLWDWVVHFTSTAEEAIVAAADSLWIYFWLFTMSLIDGVFPLVPSETIVITTSTLWKQTGSPLLPFIWLAAAAGAWCGDQLTYLLGSKIHIRSLRLFRGPKGQRTLDWAEHALTHRGAAFIIAARFIPFGRVAVNLTAGALAFPRRRFMIIDAIAVAIWATYGVLIGITAASIFENLLVSILVGVAGGIALGWLVDRILARFGVSVPDADEAPAVESPRAEHTKMDSRALLANEFFEVTRADITPFVSDEATWFSFDYLDAVELAEIVESHYGVVIDETTLAMPFWALLDFLDSNRAAEE